VERELAWVFLARMATLQAIHRHEVRQLNDLQMENPPA
jgi:hypothetical protein